MPRPSDLARKFSFPPDIAKGSPLFCVNLLAGVMELGLCADLGGFMRLVLRILFRFPYAQDSSLHDYI